MYMRRIPKILYKSRQWLALCCVLVLAYVLRVLIITHGLPYPYHCDEPNLIHNALRILKTGDYNPHWFGYPTLLTYIHTLDSVFCYFYAVKHHLLRDMTEVLTNADTGWWWSISHPIFYFWGRHVTVVFGTLSVGLVYLICRRYSCSLFTAILASVFLACNIPYLHLSRVITVDVPTSFFVLATAFSSILLMVKGERKYYLIAGLLAGFAISAKYNAYPAALLPLLAHILNKEKKAFFSPDVLLIIAAVPLGFLIGTPYAIGDLPGFLKGAGDNVWYYSNFGENSMMLQQLVFFYHGFCEDRWAMGGGGGVGTFLVYAAVCGMFTGFLVNRRLQILLLSYPVAYVLFMSTMRANFMRNMIVVNAYLCIFAALFIYQASTFIYKSLKKKIAVSEGVFFTAVLAIFLIMPLYKGINWTIKEFNQTDSRVLAVQWLEKNVAPPHKVALARELRWFMPHLDKLGFEHVLVGQLEKDPAWYGKEGFEYVVVAKKYINQEDPGMPLLQKYNESFSNMPVAAAFGTQPMDLNIFTVDPKLAIVKVAASPEKAGNSKAPR